VDAEGGGVDFAAAEGDPGFAAGEEFAGAQVVGRVQRGLPEDLGVDADPAGVVPVLGDPVVEALARLEVRGETAADPRGDAAVTEERSSGRRSGGRRSAGSRDRFEGSRTDAVEARERTGGGVADELSHVGDRRVDSEVEQVFYLDHRTGVRETVFPTVISDVVRAVARVAVMVEADR
jgi:hypothetical protein